MSDIVERLRAWSGTNLEGDYRTVAAAADEIVRLRSRLADCTASHQRANLEIERLDQKVERIAELTALIANEVAEETRGEIKPIACTRCLGVGVGPLSISGFCRYCIEEHPWLMLDT